MTHDHFVVQQPATPAQQLLLLFHGQGENPQGMAEPGRWFAESFPQAMVISVGAPLPCGPSPGAQWYSTRDMDDAARVARVDAALAGFVEKIRHWQMLSGVRPEATALIGFSQGAIMALEAIARHPELAGRVVAFSGRFARLPERASTRTTLHLIHGEQDDKIVPEHALLAAERIQTLGGDITVDIVADLPHAIDDRAMAHALNHLHNTVPKRYFDEALGGSPPRDDDVVAFM
ncbi:esterase [Enterobacterales bacterium CwR94]|nr:esterase [Enterobacterales bacterium CwR94]